MIVGANGVVLGSGHTQQVGKSHAEISALADAKLKGHCVIGATMYVTLEPCAHVGRTGPCANAIVEAGIAKVVASIGDPNPKVSGKGFEILRAAGVNVEIGAGAMKAKNLNLGFFSRFIRQRPWIRLKIASSLDGRTALLNDQSKWITGNSARQDGHVWRGRASAIMTGIGTILKDDPRLDCRFGSVTEQPMLAIIDSQLRTPSSAKIFDTERKTIIYGAQIDRERQKTLESKGALVIYLPDRNSIQPSVDLKAVMTDLAQREINELHIEAGAKLNGSLIKNNLVDEYLIYIAPKIIGPGYPFAQLDALQDLSELSELQFISCELIGQDLRVIAREPGRTEF